MTERRKSVPRGKTPAAGGSTAKKIVLARQRQKQEDKKLLEGSLLAAIILHLFIIYLVIPDFGTRVFQAPPKKVIQIKRFTPPKMEKPPPKRREVTKKAKPKPIPDPTPDQPEERTEPEPEPEPPPLPEEIDIVFGEPEGPPLPAGPIRITADMTPPELVERIEPEYPEMARRAGVQGLVILEAVIKKDGTVGDVRVIRSMGNTGLDEAAIEAASQWKFRPALSNGQPVAVYMTLTVQFNLR